MTHRFGVISVLNILFACFYRLPCLLSALSKELSTACSHALVACGWRTPCKYPTSSTVWYSTVSIMPSLLQHLHYSLNSVNLVFLWDRKVPLSHITDVKVKYMSSFTSWSTLIHKETSRNHHPMKQARTSDNMTPGCPEFSCLNISHHCTPLRCFLHL